MVTVLQLSLMCCLLTNTLNLELRSFSVNHEPKVLCLLQEWKNTYFKASTALQFRERKLEDAAQLIENNLTLLGATAIEDKLQDEVRGV